MEAEPPKADPPKRKRRLFQFSLRTLMIFTLIVAIPSAWFGIKIEQKRRERDAVELIVKLGGTAYFDFQTDSSGGYIEDATAPGPQWVRDVFGENLYSNVSVVFLPDTMTDADLECVDHLPNLQFLDINGAITVTNAGLSHLRGPDRT
jgi:hypothetical protein